MITRAAPAARNQVAFAVDAWAAWAPGLPDHAAWLDWSQNPSVPTGDQRPELPNIAPMLRRRAERLARMAMHTASALRTGAPAPMIFASQRGETQRAADMLAELARSGQAAPGPFSLSVHNAVSALDSIAHGDTSNHIALAAGMDTAELAMIEAAGLLAEGHPQVIVTVYDERLPTCYQRYVEEADAPFAWSWRLSSAAANGHFELSWEPADAPAPSTPSTLPRALSLLRYFLSNDTELSHDGTHCRWTWRRTAKAA